MEDEKTDLKDFATQLIELEYGKFKVLDWFEIEQWLWDKHKVYFKLITGFFGFQYTSHINENDFVKSTISNSPITAKIEAIKAAVKYLHEQIKK